MAQLSHDRSAQKARGVIRSLSPAARAVLAVLAAIFLAVIALGVVSADGDRRAVIASGEIAMEDSGGGRDDAGRIADGPSAGTTEEDRATVVVDVSGAVRSPSVVELPEGSRVDDAIERAGGLAKDADVSTLNRAALLVDGMKILVPSSAGQQASSSGARASGSDASSGRAMVNINTASAEQLDALSGVGPATAEAIIEDREANGPFASPEDLMRVSGIGEKKFEKLKASVCI